MSSKQMNRISMGAAATMSVFALVACGSGNTTAAPSSSPSAAPSTPAGQSAAPTTPSTSGPAAPAGATPRCTTKDLSVSLGTPKEQADAPGQFDVPLKFKNTSARTCDLHGVPGVDLTGPSYPNGAVYHLTRVDNGVAVNDVAAGSSANASITVLKATAGSTGSNGSQSWTPTQLVTIPPGQTEALTAAWPSDLPVVRQDTASRPGTFVNGFLSGPA